MKPRVIGAFKLALRNSRVPVRCVVMPRSGSAGTRCAGRSWMQWGAIMRAAIRIARVMTAGTLARLR
jgi:hypothetical protein